MILALAKQAKAGAATPALYPLLADGGLTMNSNIIDKSAFFRSRAKPTDAEYEARFIHLISLLGNTLDDLVDGKFSPEQRVSIMTQIVDFSFTEVHRKDG